MPPKKGFTGAVNYLDRNVHDDLLELLPESTVETVQVKRLTSLNHRLRIADGLYDKGNWVRDAQTSQTGLSLFKKWFAERKLYAPHANIWNFDLGKLVVPSVFMDFDLLENLPRTEFFLSMVLMFGPTDDGERVSACRYFIMHKEQAPCHGEAATIVDQIKK